MVESLKSSIKHENIDFKTFTPAGEDLNEEKKSVVVIPNYEPGSKISTRKAYGEALKKAR